MDPEPVEGLIRLRPDVEWRDVDGEVVALDLATAAYLSVNDTGSLLWPLVARGATQVQLVTELVRHFALDSEQAGADVAAFVTQLRSLALVEEPG